MKKLLLLFLLLPLGVFAQQTMASQTTILGSQHPELIPDEDAVGCVFWLHSRLDTPAHIADSAVHRAKIRFTDPKDRTAYDSAMSAHFNQLQANHNAGPTTTLSDLKVTLSPAGFAQLWNFIQDEKRFMRTQTQKPTVEAVGEGVTP